MPNLQLHYSSAERPLCRMRQAWYNFADATEQNACKEGKKFIVLGIRFRFDRLAWYRLVSLNCVDTCGPDAFVRVSLATRARRAEQTLMLLKGHSEGTECSPQLT